MTRILAIDSSLSGTGLCRLVIDSYDADGYVGDYSLVTLAAPKKRGGHQDMSRRITHLLARIDAAMAAEPFDLIVLEDIPYSAQPNHPLVWLWGKIIDRTVGRTLPLIVVNASTIKKFATGDGRAKKEVVALAMTNRYPALGIADNNQADAAALAMIGARFLGRPVDSMPKSHLQSKGLRDLALET